MSEEQIEFSPVDITNFYDDAESPVQEVDEGITVLTHNEKALYEELLTYVSFIFLPTLFANLIIMVS